MSPAEELHCLCVNAGSSSLKLALYRIADDGTEIRLGEASASEIGRPEAALEVKGHTENRPLADHHEAFPVLVQALNPSRVDALGHRVVHGGGLDRPALVTAELLDRLDAVTPLAPLHNPPALAAIRSALRHFPHSPQVACFDTAFHATLPEVAHTLPLPQRYREAGLRRYGFHGLSYEYVLRKLGSRALGRLVIAHLGNGASLSAVLHGRCVDTSMGFTPSGGIMMGTRSGDLDPGVMLYLARTEGLDPTALEHVIDRESGLLGVSGHSANMATLLADDTPDSRLAVSLFAYHVRKTIGAYAAVLGGLDRLVFTGGIGEHAAAVRWRVCRGLEYLGIELDTLANDTHAERISTPTARCAVEVVATDEDAMIARHVHETLVTHHAE
ncbi:acetate/propionate family kinase [Acidihalobacter aeolianus]|uniref:acetate/propionate family kinase n=1 Tax=Acidihalobacter aeolianus TaxID=2792603 RepID=UPI0009F3C20E|nr:acetate/propionate family kinase [Acidihalobacter aeolianus]